jgi:2-octaprenyl-6-methoxyphenol hydroxylase
MTIAVAQQDLAADAAVIGAGAAGMTAVLALATAGTTVLIAAPAYDPARAAADQRTTALLPSSIELLKNLGAWETCAGAGAPLRGVRIVDDRGGLLRAPELLFNAAELGLSCFAVNAPNGALTAALHAAVARQAGLRWLPTSSVTRVTPGKDAVTMELAEGGVSTARLAVAADGRNSIARRAAGIAARTWGYGQVAITATFRHTRPHHNITTELHRRAGPLTTVPLPGDASSLVWVETPDEASRLAALDNGAFLAELSRRLQGLLGRLQEVSPRAAYPLSGLHAAYMGQRRIALVGEAAHVIPPIGAQGLNLGLRDAATLADCVAAARAEGRDIGGAGMLEAYHAARAADVLARTVSVDLLNRSLLADFVPGQTLRGLGLHLLANVGPLRELLMRGGLGAPGPLPHLMRPAGSQGLPGNALDGGADARQVGRQQQG